MAILSLVVHLNKNLVLQLLLGVRGELIMVKIYICYTKKTTTTFQKGAYYLLHSSVNMES